MKTTKKATSKPMGKKQLKKTKGGLLPAVRLLPAVQMPTDQITLNGFQGGCTQP